MYYPQTKVTSKYQATIPQAVRQALGLKSGGLVTWQVVEGKVFLDARPKITGGVRFLANQVQVAGHDAVKLVREVRRELV